MSPKNDKTATQKRLDFELAQSTVGRGGHNSLQEVNEMEENRNELKERYARGKSLGQSVNEIRNKIKEKTNEIE
jgi:hypothetical protein